MNDEIKRLQEVAGIIDTPGEYAYTDKALSGIVEDVLLIIGPPEGDPRLARRDQQERAKSILESIRYNVMQTLELRKYEE